MGHPDFIIRTIKLLMHTLKRYIITARGVGFITTTCHACLGFCFIEFSVPLAKIDDLHNP